MEIGCRPNRAWSMLSSSSSPDSLTHTGSWDSILCLSWLQVPCHCGVPPPYPALILTLTEWASGQFSRREACNDHQSFHQFKHVKCVWTGEMARVMFCCQTASVCQNCCVINALYKRITRPGIEHKRSDLSNWFCALGKIVLGLKNTNTEIILRYWVDCVGLSMGLLFPADLVDAITFIISIEIIAWIVVFYENLFHKFNSISKSILCFPVVLKAVWSRDFRILHISTTILFLHGSNLLKLFWGWNTASRFFISILNSNFQQES